MESIEEQVKEILSWFLYQVNIKKVITEDKLIKVYQVEDDLVRVDIKVNKRWKEKMFKWIRKKQ